ncbi:MAG TPA: thiol oxidoreductase-like protein, partial [Planctomycetota bacterium]|nr:thiol oxidoreductase-like protein [Planctomycetota bacterium]
MPRPFRSSLPSVLLAAFVLAAASSAHAQLTDLTQTPNAAKAGIRKSLEQEIGAGRGDIFTPGSSAYMIARDPFRAVARGRQLFQRKFTLAQGSGPRKNDGIGDISADHSIGAGLADSCASCHGRPFGSAGTGGNVFTRPESRDAPHLFGIGLVEMLGDEITDDLRRLADIAAANALASHHDALTVLASKGIDYGVLVAHADGTLDTSGVIGVDADLRVKPFFHQGGAFAIRDFVVGALNAEMGIQSADPDLLMASRGLDV